MGETTIRSTVVLRMGRIRTLVRLTRYFARTAQNAPPRRLQAALQMKEDQWSG